MIDWFKELFVGFLIYRAAKWLPDNRHKCSSEYNDEQLKLRWFFIRPFDCIALKIYQITAM